MLNSSDYIYGIFLSGSYYKIPLLKALYKKDPEQFMKFLNILFHEQFKQEIVNALNIPYNGISYTQSELFNGLREVVSFYESNLGTLGLNFLNSRGINKSTISKYKMGSTEGVFNKQKFEDFISVLENKKIPKAFIIQLMQLHSSLMTVTSQLYGNPHFVSIPSYNVNGDCTGICLRSIGHKKIGEGKNVFKFHFLNAPDYLFGEQFIDNYDTVFVTEGVFDVLALHELGIYNVVCLGNVTMSKWQYAKLKDKNLIFIMDNDLGGLNGIERFKQTFVPNHTKTCKFFTTFDDRDLADLPISERELFISEVMKNAA